MPKALTIFSMVVAGLTVFAFAFDLALGFPFNKAYWPADVCFLICAIIVAYLSWITLREQRLPPSLTAVPWMTTIWLAATEGCSKPISVAFAGDSGVSIRGNSSAASTDSRAGQGGWSGTHWQYIGSRLKKIGQLATAGHGASAG